MLSKSCPEVIQELINMGFKINWTLLKIGYLGHTFLRKQISCEEICSYAEGILETMKSDYELIAQLIVEKNNEYDFREILDQLARKENVDLIVQERKWRAYVVVKTLSSLPNDYFNGLLELTDLWCALGFPKDSPYAFQGQNNLYSLQEYYTQDMFNFLVAKTRQWARDEIEHIKQLEK